MTMIRVRSWNMRKFRALAFGLLSVVSLGLGSSGTAEAHSSHAAPTAQWRQTWNDGWQAYQTLVAIPLAQRGYATATQDLPIVINRKLDDVFEAYADVNNALGLHPFLTQIIPIASKERHGITTNDFVALENIPLPDGTVFPGETIARQRINEDGHYYDVDTYDAPGIVTHQHITFTAIDRTHTLVTERLTFEAPPVYIGLATQGGVYAHLAVQQGLKAAIESGRLRHD
jgi:hypothetical protein